MRTSVTAKSVLVMFTIAVMKLNWLLPLQPHTVLPSWHMHRKKSQRKSKC